MYLMKVFHDCVPVSHCPESGGYRSVTSATRARDRPGSATPATPVLSGRPVLTGSLVSSASATALGKSSKAFTINPKFLQTVILDSL
jgi:hypothetical protein